MARHIWDKAFDKVCPMDFPSLLGGHGSLYRAQANDKIIREEREEARKRGEVEIRYKCPGHKVVDYD